MLLKLVAIFLIGVAIMGASAFLPSYNGVFAIVGLVLSVGSIMTYLGCFISGYANGGCA